MTCPSCGAEASGKFCDQCGTALGPGVCRSCSAQLSEGARFCHRCGSPAGGVRGGRTPWMVAATIIVLSLSIIVYGVIAQSHAPPPVPDMANPGAGGAPTGGSPPDISQMTPSERFIRLNDRITTAFEQGDSATALRFLPMALTAYTMLDSADVDARYHAATLQIAAGQPDAALALADTIQATAPDNLLGWIVRTSAAVAKRDRAGILRARKAFLAAYDAQIKLDRPEYREHRAVLQTFRQTAADSTR